MFPPTPTWFVTAGSQQGRISLDGRSARSSAWRGGAAYVQMCLTCGLEPSRLGHASNCLCMCGLGKGRGGCGRILHGHGNAEGMCRVCGGGRPEMVSIGTIEVKRKRSRESYVPHVLRPSQAPAAVASAAAVVASVAASVASAAAGSPTASAAGAVASWPTYLTYGHFRSCGHM